MMRMLHLIPIVLITAAVTSALKADGGKTFWREFLKGSFSLLTGYVVLAAVIFALAYLIGNAF